MSDILVVPPVASTPEISITDEGMRLQQRLLEASCHILAVDSILSRDSAIMVASSIKAHLKEVEANRQEVLKPFHSTTTAINTAARDHVAAMDLELKRINRLVGQFEVVRQKEEFFETPKSKPHGGAMRKDWDITITDLKALYAASPQCVTLSPNMLAIKDLLKAGITPPGITASPTAAYNARAKK